jgi:hypothetical protein
MGTCIWGVLWGVVISVLCQIFFMRLILFTIPTIFANTNIQYLFSLPLETIRIFPGDDGSAALLPDWMREDLNVLAVRLYDRFLDQLDHSDKDYRDAEWVLREFRKWQLEVVDINRLDALRDVLNNENDPPTMLATFEGIRKLLGKIGTDFVNKMGFPGGSKFLYMARMWAEVLGPGDAVAPTFMASEGAQIAGVIHTHAPSGIKGSPVFEILDPRGHNPPFGKDERMNAIPGVAMLFPAWATRMTPPHRCCVEGVEPNEFEQREPRLANHRIDWVFEIGLFQYPQEELEKFVDWENCPFKDSYSIHYTQSHFDLSLSELVALAPPENIRERISAISGTN